MRLQLFENGLRSRISAQFMAKLMGQHHLYEIHTAPQGELVSAVLSASHIYEIVRLRDFL
jgi:hypothetical protein